jgi:uncharacterized protein (DUF3820 family)
MLTGESLMPFGKFKGEKMESLPPWYLLKIYENNIRNRNHGRMADVMLYITDNLESLQEKSK